MSAMQCSNINDSNNNNMKKNAFYISSLFSTMDDSKHATNSCKLDFMDNSHILILLNNFQYLCLKKASKGI